MKIRRSALVALLLAAGAIGSLAVLTLAPIHADQGRPPLAPVSNQIDGRYQIIFNPNVRADLFLLDTETGRTWVHVEASDYQGNPTFWQYQARIDNFDDMVAWVKAHTPKQSK